MKRVLMIGAALSVKGGVSSVERIYLDAWDRERYALRHLATFVDGGMFRKLARLLLALLRYLQLLLTWRPDIVHIHFSWRASFYRKVVFVLLAVVARRRIVMHCHSGGFSGFYNGQGRIGKMLIRGILNLADALIVVSESLGDFFEGLDLKVPIRVLNNPVAMTDVFTRTGTLQPDPVILALGKLCRQKGTYDLLSALRKVKEPFPNVRLWLGGDGELESVKRVIDSLGLVDNVRLLGWVDEADKQAALQAATLFVHCSYFEGMPMAILEAMQHELPVVATNVGGIPELITHQQTGVLIEPGDVQGLSDRIISLLQDGEARARLGQAARQSVHSRFAATRVVNQLLNTYDAILETPRGSQTLKASAVAKDEEVLSALESTS